MKRNKPEKSVLKNILEQQPKRVLTPIAPVKSYVHVYEQGKVNAKLVNITTTETKPVKRKRVYYTDKLRNEQVRKFTRLAYTLIVVSFLSGAFACWCFMSIANSAALHRAFTNGQRSGPTK